MDDHLRRLVWERAGACCEYCHLPEACTSVPFEIDHVIARKHGGATEPANLALSCFYCNSYKGPNIAGIDRTNGEVVRLFNPRVDRWADHFSWSGPWLVGRSAIGRVTIAVLEINHADAIAVRAALIAEGVYEKPV